jgi:hypothetical protein
MRPPLRGAGALTAQAATSTITLSGSGRSCAR